MIIFRNTLLIQDAGSYVGSYYARWLINVIILIFVTCFLFRIWLKYTQLHLFLQRGEVRWKSHCILEWERRKWRCVGRSGQTQTLCSYLSSHAHTWSERWFQTLAFSLTGCLFSLSLLLQVLIYKSLLYQTLTFIFFWSWQKASWTEFP